MKEAGVIARTAEAAETVGDAANVAGVAEKASVTAVKEVTAQTTEKALFKKLKDVVKFLKENGINNQKDRCDIIEAFNPGAEVIESNKDVVVYRYYGGNSNPRGKWLTTELLKDPVNQLALPPGNKAENIQQWIIPKGTKVLKGTVAPHWDKTDGAPQIFIPDPKILK